MRKPGLDWPRVLWGTFATSLFVFLLVWLGNIAWHFRLLLALGCVAGGAYLHNEYFGHLLYELGNAIDAVLEKHDD